MLVLVQDEVQQLRTHILWRCQCVLLEVGEGETGTIVNQLVIAEVVVLPPKFY